MKKMEMPTMIVVLLPMFVPLVVFMLTFLIPQVSKWYESNVGNTNNAGEVSRNMIPAQKYIFTRDFRFILQIKVEDEVRVGEHVAAIYIEPIWESFDPFYDEFRTC